MINQDNYHDHGNNLPEQELPEVFQQQTLEVGFQVRIRQSPNQPPEWKDCQKDYQLFIPMPFTVKEIY